MTQQNPYNRKLRDRIKKRDGNACRTCGATENLTIHHIDHDHRNNTPDNLITLCKECHDNLHRKKKKSREHRQEHKQNLKKIIRDLTASDDEVDLIEALVEFADIRTDI